MYCINKDINTINITYSGVKQKEKKDIHESGHCIFF